MDLCGACGTDDVVEIRVFGDASVHRMCQRCGSETIHQVQQPVTPNYCRSQPPSVNQMMHRIQKTEEHLPLSAMERKILDAQNAEAAQDLVILLGELQAG